MKIKKKFKLGEMNRAFDIALESSVEEQDHKIHISFSSETPYPRWFGTEVLEVIGHDEGDMDMSRLNNKAAVLFNHDFDKLIGVVEEAWIEGKKGHAIIRLSSTAGQYSTMLNEGILTKVSFGYEITDMIQIGEQNGIPVVKVKTSPYELSLVSVPADDSVGFGRTKSKVEKDFELEIEDGKEENTDENKDLTTDEPEKVEGNDSTEEEKTKENETEVVNNEESEEEKAKKDKESLANIDNEEVIDENKERKISGG